jgi:hypothetical protein
MELSTFVYFVVRVQIRISVRCTVHKHSIQYAHSVARSWQEFTANVPKATATLGPPARILWTTACFMRFHGHFEMPVLTDFL